MNVLFVLLNILSQIIVAAKRIKEQNYSIYIAAKINSIPLNSLKNYLNRSVKGTILKMGTPFALTLDLEIVLHILYSSYTKIGIQFNSCANSESYFSVVKISFTSINIIKVPVNGGGQLFKKRYNLSLRIPETLFVYSY